MRMNVIESVVQNNLCVGCGACAGVCPNNSLKMKFNEYGEYNPIENSSCLKNCTMCLQVCPFHSEEENEDTLAKMLFGDIEGIKHRSEIGYYSNTYVGYSNINDHRFNGASGGIATWLLEALLSSDIVDYVVCVTSSNDPEKLFMYRVFDDTQLIRNSSRSVYYPVEMSEIIQEITATKSRYAITGVPCFIKALRLIARKSKRLRENTIATIGLVCGQMKSKHYTTYLAKLAGVEGKLKLANYRGKDPDKPANKFTFHCVNEKNNAGAAPWDDGVQIAWTNRWFTPKACNFCDDVFAELADVTLMDAWLPEYYSDSKGTNLVITRSPIIDDVMNKGISDSQIIAADIPVEKIIESQDGVLNIKKRELAYRLYCAEQNGLQVPAKRVDSSKSMAFYIRKLIGLRDNMQYLSKRLFLKHYTQHGLDLEAFQKEMRLPLISAKMCMQFTKIRRVLGKKQ